MLNPKQRVHLSKWLSKALRHEPAILGLTLDQSGWVDVETLLTAFSKHGQVVTRDDLIQVVTQCEKQRFAFNDDETRIRANQGHSIAVQLNLPPATPPAILYHGTPEQFVAAIQATGLQKMRRHHVHLSADVDTALRVGNRRGKSVVLEIAADRMAAEGFVFHVSANGVWLVDCVPPNYIQILPPLAKPT